MESIPPDCRDAWIFPVGAEERAYQLSISERALKRNTLVCLPTGLGKTFIAAVLMYNFHRWFPDGIFIFMAPTRPLVKQQKSAMLKFVPLDPSMMVELTGTMKPENRNLLWASKKFFFMTPQIMTNDMCRQVVPMGSVRLLIIDEAHRATGDHAYVQVVNQVWDHHKEFRILALTATPGKDQQRIYEVLNTLKISHVEVRQEDSMDVVPYIKKRTVEQIVVPLGGEIYRYKEAMFSVAEKYVQDLQRANIVQTSHRFLSRFKLIQCMEQLRQGNRGTFAGPAISMVSFCVSLYYGLELLDQHGLRPFYSHFRSILSGEKNPEVKARLERDEAFMELMRELERKLERQGEAFVIGHPKLEKLRDLLLDHFQRHDDRNTKVMIFSQYRESVEDITCMLKNFEPMIRAKSFVGQTSAGKSTKGITQKEQLKVVKDFSSKSSDETGFNVLVCTCVAEEGLDIDDVDLIVCFDSNRSPIRLIQRMGRTGRKTAGRMIALCSEGKEANAYLNAVSQRGVISRVLSDTTALRQNLIAPLPWPFPETKVLRCEKMGHQPMTYESPAVADRRKPSVAGRAGKRKNPDGDGDDCVQVDADHEDEEGVAQPKAKRGRGGATNARGRGRGRGRGRAEKAGPGRSGDLRTMFANAAERSLLNESTSEPGPSRAREEPDYVVLSDDDEFQSIPGRPVAPSPAKSTSSRAPEDHPLDPAWASFDAWNREIHMFEERDPAVICTAREEVMDLASTPGHKGCDYDSDEGVDCKDEDLAELRALAEKAAHLLLEDSFRVGHERSAVSTGCEGKDCLECPICDDVFRRVLRLGGEKECLAPPTPPVVRQPSRSSIVQRRNASQRPPDATPVIAKTPKQVRIQEPDDFAFLDSDDLFDENEIVALVDEVTSKHQPIMSTAKKALLKSSSGAHTSTPFHKNNTPSRPVLQKGRLFDLVDSPIKESPQKIEGKDRIKTKEERNVSFSVTQGPFSSTVASTTQLLAAINASSPGTAAPPPAEKSQKATNNRHCLEDLLDDDDGFDMDFDNFSSTSPIVSQRAKSMNIAGVQEDRRARDSSNGRLGTPESRRRELSFVIENDQPASSPPRPAAGPNLSAAKVHALVDLCEPDSDDDLFAEMDLGEGDYLKSSPSLARNESTNVVKSPVVTPVARSDSSAARNPQPSENPSQRVLQAISPVVSKPQRPSLPSSQRLFKRPLFPVQTNVTKKPSSPVPVLKSTAASPKQKEDDDGWDFFDDEVVERTPQKKDQKATQKTQGTLRVYKCSDSEEGGDEDDDWLMSAYDQAMSDRDLTTGVLRSTTTVTATPAVMPAKVASQVPTNSVQKQTPSSPIVSQKRVNNVAVRSLERSSMNNSLPPTRKPITHVLSDSEDEVSFIAPPPAAVKRRRILDSSEDHSDVDTPPRTEAVVWKSPLRFSKPAEVSKKGNQAKKPRIHVLDDEDDDDFAAHSTRRARPSKKAKSKPAGDVFDDDDDFVAPIGRALPRKQTRAPKQVKDSQASRVPASRAVPATTKAKKAPRKKRGARTGRNFILDDVDVSLDQTVSGDESERSSDDEGELSMIDDRAVLTQDPGVDMAAVYLRSTKENVHRPGAFRLKYNSNVPDEDIFSQAPQLDTTESDSDMDGFIVDDDAVEEPAPESDEEVTVLDVVLSETRQTRRGQRNKKPVETKRQRRRIVELSSDSD